MNALGLNVLSNLTVLESLGIETEPLLEGLRFTRAELLAGRKWVLWDDVAAFYDRLEPSLDEAQVREIGRLHMTRHPALRVMAQFAVSASAWLDLLWRVSRPVNPMAELTYDMGPVEHRLDVKLREGQRPCSLWFRVSHYCGVFATEPIGAQPLEVLSCDVGDRSVSSRFAPPVERSSAERLARASEIPLTTVFDSFDLLGAQELGTAVRDGHLQFSAELRPLVDEVTGLGERWGLTPAEARVALVFAEGRTPAEVAEATELSVATVRGHLKHAYAKTQSPGQRQLRARLAAWRLK